jgi:hypothetical protein
MEDAVDWFLYGYYLASVSNNAHSQVDQMDFPFRVFITS